MTANPNYPGNEAIATKPTAEESTVPPVAGWFDADPMILCRWCGFMLRFGRGPTQHVEFCTICKNEIEESENV